MTQEASLSAALTTPPQARRTPPFALIVSLVALATVGGLAWQQHRINKTLQQSYAQQGEQLQMAQGRAQAAQDTLQALQRDVAQLSAKQAEAQSQQANLTAMYEAFARNDSQRVLLEAEQALTYASQQLQLTGRTDVAIGILTTLDSQMQSLDRPELIKVRQAVTRDLEALKALPTLDTVGLAGQIDSMVDGLDAVPLDIELQRTPQPPVTPSEQGNVLQRFAGEVWGNIKQLVQIRRMDKADSVLLTPEQALLLRENMKLRLLDARSAVLQRDATSYKADLSAVGNYLSRYFDPQAKPTRHMQDTLNSLSQVDIALPQTDLSASIYAIRTARAAAEKAKP